jgi:hypothetical protein
MTNSTAPDTQSVVIKKPSPTRPKNSGAPSPKPNSWRNGS